MHTTNFARRDNVGFGHAALLGVLIAAAAALAVPPALAADAPPQSVAAKKKPSAAKQRTYAAPEEAVKDFVAAMKAGDETALLSILGPEAKPLVSSGDKVADREGLERFVQSFEEANRLEKSGDGKVALVIGKDEWAFPIPIVKESAGWRFDTQAGSEEILNRRIGRNEISATQAMLAYVDAQRDYYLQNPQKSALLHYAQKFMSTPGKRDGLYYPTQAGEPPSPLGPLFASARAKGYVKAKAGQPTAYYGYHYRILKAQGPDAPGGAYDYLANGEMIGGFALVAWPATYGNSGVMTFIVNHDGVVYEKDLGPETSAAVQKMETFNPDKSWKKTADSGKK
ncbi:MAG: hypothetical protein H6R10_2293 [Rhodocyclaceae bacterium]|nr:hypothetical protein [Rhodocyclaceae bacterium]